ncbi:hypothetical protein MAR_028812 [Mya arenaria]|uniref:Uncharacterized protein n=1 Tax=Mya arenaria TaxID=6604 RepID=A0ABY7DHC8_MYAAR|nr:hypothetical protein MAR_028812 [Mya arenaria]
MIFNSPILKDLSIVIDENGTEFIYFEAFHTFMKSNRRESEPLIKKSNLFKYLKGKDHSVKEITGKIAFRLESGLQYFFTHNETYDVCRQVAKYIKKITESPSNSNGNDSLTSTKDIYERAANANFLNRHLLSSVPLNEGEITTLNSSYKDDFSPEKWAKICLFEAHFMREASFDLGTETYESLIMKKSIYFQEMQKAEHISNTIFQQSKNEILLRMKRQEISDMDNRIYISGNYMHCPSIGSTKGSETYISDIKAIISSFVKTNHKETFVEFVFFSDTLKLYSDSSGDCMRFKLRDDFLS